MSSTMRPSARNRARSAYDAAIGSWVTITIVWPISRTAVRMNERISAPVRESRLPVGSSAKMISGRLASARATATRCCWPPESSEGRCLTRLPRPTVSITRFEPVRVGLAAGEHQRQRDVLQRGQRRHQVERLEDEADAVAAQLGELLVVERAEVGVADEDVAAASACRARRRLCISVDLPEPDGPMIAVNWPATNSTVTPSRAWTSDSPRP